MQVFRYRIAVYPGLINQVSFDWGLYYKDIAVVWRRTKYHKALETDHQQVRKEAPVID